MDFISVLKSCHLPAADGKLWHARLFRWRSFLFVTFLERLSFFLKLLHLGLRTDMLIIAFFLCTGNDVFLPETSEGFTVSVLLVTGHEKLVSCQE